MMRLDVRLAFFRIGAMKEPYIFMTRSKAAIAAMVVLAGFVLLASTGFAQVVQTSPKKNGGVSPVQEPSKDDPVGYMNWKTVTFGGKQFWTDVRHADGWKIQVNSETGHHRLLNSNSVRHAWGNLAHCDQALNSAIKEGKAKLHRGKVVILLHGLIRTNSSMNPLENYLRKTGGYSTINFQYASTRKEVAEHAMALKSVIDNLGPEVTEVNFVCHSLGNIVVRNYLFLAWDPLKGKQGDPRIKRMVMIGPPNQGSKMARLLRSSVLFKTIAGVSGIQLASGWNKLSAKLATPNFQFGIIAGGQESEEKLSNFVLKGKDDFTVSLEEAKLDGAHDLLVRPLLHSTMMHQPVTMESTLRFLKSGFFISEESRQPIPVAAQSK